MYVKQFYLILLLTFICAAWDIDSTDDVKSEVENVSEDVLYLGRTCASDADCFNLGRCEARSGGKFCKCKRGTSGDFCEKVDECVNNPAKCGTLDDVSCVFRNETAVCKCANETKTYVEEEKRCMSPCDDSHCGRHGDCVLEVGNQTFCQCYVGASGDFCEIIDQCHNKIVDCGADNNATCTLGGKGKAYCKCDDLTKGFDYEEKICKDCSGCGENAFGSGRCSYRDGIRRCVCKNRYYSSDNGRCEDCKCGQDSYGCKFENGTKICQCWLGSAHNDGLCQKCDCDSGPEVSKCQFKNGKKVCTCKEGYSSKGPDGQCKKMCNATAPCANGGKCLQNVCSCLKGTSGDLCQTIDECKGWGKCGRVECHYNVSSQEAYCKCEGSLKFDDYSKACRRTCASDADCFNLGRCEARSGGKFCKCKRGTSGDFCEKVDECVNNPAKCGTLDDVSCVFRNETAVCKCANETKTYVEEEKRCMTPCDDSHCGRHGDCVLEVGNQTFCQCYPGASGDFCEIIDQCHNKVVDCGVDNNATCTLGGKAYCKCDDLTKGFDYKEKICKDCSGCGENAVGSGRCAYRDGIRRCVCKSRYYSSDNGRCEDCKCGQGSYGCEFENGTKICQCWSGSAHNDGLCQKCDCGSGPGVSKCEFKNGKKVCTCKEGYSSKGPDGQCKQTCNATTPCANGGKCLQNVCSCLKGTSGDLCQTIDECKGWGKCGRVECHYNVSSQEAYCKCEGSLKFDDYSKACKVCSCGSYTKSCAFVEGKKRCKCSDLYEDRLGKCTFCYCKGYASMYGCKFDDKGDMKCRCLKGYSQDGDICKECDCGDHGKCHLYGWGSKYCTCDEGYAEKDGKCEECDCGENGSCDISFSGKKICFCADGYKEYQGTCKACDCGWKATCEFDEFGTKVCTCETKYAMKNGICTPCYCEPGTNCTFTSSIFYGEKKECHCPKGYADDRGKCRTCDCEVKGSNCTFSLGFNECQCPEGYVSAYKSYSTTEKYCEDIDECKYFNSCPRSSTMCVNTPGSYECVCRDGYEEPYSSNIKRDGCTDINECIRKFTPCNDKHATCVNTPGSYRCECRSGYLSKGGYEQQNICKPDLGSRPWRTGSITVGVASALIIIGLLIAITKKCSS